MKESWRPASERDMEVIMTGEKVRAKTTMKTVACIEVFLMIVILIIGALIQMVAEDEIMRKRLGYDPSSEFAKQQYVQKELRELREIYGYDYDRLILLEAFDDIDAKRQAEMRELRKAAQKEIAPTVTAVYSIIVAVLLLIYLLVYCDTKLRYKRFKNSKLIVCNGVCKGKRLVKKDWFYGTWEIKMEGRSQNINEYANLWKIPTIVVDLEDGSTKEVLVSKNFYENVSIGEKMLAVQFENTTRPDWIASIYCFTEE